MDEEKITGLFETLESIDDPALLGDLLESIQQRLQARQSNDRRFDASADRRNDGESAARLVVSVETEASNARRSGSEKGAETPVQLSVAVCAFAERWRGLGARLEDGEVALESLLASNEGENS
jgi:hypothetical protein